MEKLTPAQKTEFQMFRKAIEWSMKYIDHCPDHNVAIGWFITNLLQEIGEKYGYLTVDEILENIGVKDFSDREYQSLRRGMYQ